MRQIVLDTETTGLETEQGHRIIEIGCVEVANRRLTGNDLHLYINPDREIDAGAQAVHGISLDDLADKPRFADIAAEFMTYIGTAELVIHNAPFDLGFLNHELRLLDPQAKPLESQCSILDTLEQARQRHPGQRNSLDALCGRYAIDNSQRDLHGALLDAQLLAEVYLAMTGGQTSMALDAESGDTDEQAGTALHALFARTGKRPRIIVPDEDELRAHEAYLQRLASESGQGCLWLEGADASEAT